MIHGHKPAGYFVKGINADGHTVSGESRMCVHCQFTWEYVPGSGTTRGFCLKCHGLLCHRPECAAEQRRLLAAFPTRTDLTCVPLEDWNSRMRDQLMRDPAWTVLPSGVAVMKDMR